MTAAQALFTVQYRLAQHYVKRLQQASISIQKGQGNRAYWFDQIEQDWGQIQHWQAWSANMASQCQDAARLCIEFPLVGADILTVHQNPEDRLKWLETALLLSEGTSGISKCVILRLLYQACFHLNALDKAESYIHQLIELARVNNEPLYEGCGIYALGFIAEEHGSYDQAEYHYCQSLAIFSAIGAGTDEGRSLHGLGSIAMHRGQYQHAYDSLRRYLSLADQLGQENDVCVGLCGLAEVMIGLKNFEAAKDYAQRGAELCRAIGHRRVLSACLSALGCCEFERGDYDTALHYYKDSLQIAEIGSFRRSAIRTLHRLGYLYSHIGLYDKALEKFEQGLDLACQARQLRFLCNILRDMATTHLLLRNMAAAHYALREALEATQQLNSDLQKAKTILSGLMLWQRMGLSLQAALGAGVLLGNTDIDEKTFKTLCIVLEAELGTELFNAAIEQGTSSSMDEVIVNILNSLRDQ